MTQQAELLKRIDTLPPKYFGEVIDFVGYLEQKARQEAASPKKGELTEEQKQRDIELINRHAEELNREAMEVYLDQELDI
jgi:hypothetical protein